MPALLELSRNKEELSRQLLRRIGYTEGLFRITRHAEVVARLADELPMSIALADSRIRASMADLDSGETVTGRSSGGRSYGEGVRNVLISFRFLRRTGSKLALTPRGRALSALSRQYGSNSAQVKGLLTAAIIESDGDYSLNILAEGPAWFAINIGEALDTKREWMESLPIGPIRSFALRDLDRIRVNLVGGLPRESRSTGRRGAKAGLTDNTLRHTLTPRHGWLRELGLASSNVRQRVVRALVEARQAVRGSGRQNVVALGFDSDLARAVGLTGLPVCDREFVWSLAALAVADRPGKASVPDDFIAENYERLRLRSFNQVEVEALFDVYAATAVADGHVPDTDGFLQAIDVAVSANPSRVWRLSSRRGGTLQGYVAMSKSAGTR